NTKSKLNNSNTLNILNNTQYMPSINPLLSNPLNITNLPNITCTLPVNQNFNSNNSFQFQPVIPNSQITSPSISSSSSSPSSPSSPSSNSDYNNTNATKIYNYNKNISNNNSNNQINVNKNNMNFQSIIQNIGNT